MWRLSLVLVVLAGCQQAERYVAPQRQEPAEAKPGGAAEKPPPIPGDLYWLRDRTGKVRDDIPLVFVAEETDAARWARLPGYWNRSPLASEAGVVAVLAALTPRSPAAGLGAAALLTGAGPARVEVKVPRGLPDPTPHIPPEDPPTLDKWLLGQRLFFDKSYLRVDKDLSCAACHVPELAFASHRQFDPGMPVNTPSLLNVVYHPRIFWDGRGEVLEACLQRTLEDEREPSPPGRHVWGGAIGRIKENPIYQRQFQQVFGTWPTQDNVGRCLATYLRTLLSGDSLCDQALAKAGKAALEPAHFEAALGKEVPAVLHRPGARPADVARDLAHGSRLFHDQIAGKETACVRCHAGPLFTDRGYHNLGLDPDSDEKELRWAGRNATLPPGLRGPLTQGAYKTPSLRNAARTLPYFHTGSKENLEEAVRYHLDGTRWTSFTDPAFLNASRTDRLIRQLENDDVQALLLFLRSLNGADLPKEMVPANR